MSQKAFISAAEHLAKLDITTEQALEYVTTNLDQPELIFEAAKDNGVTRSMLSEITEISTDVINNYFSDAELDPELIDYSSILFNSDIGSLENLVNFNNNTGMLSTTSLGEKVRSSINFSDDYNFPFTARDSYQPNDNIYDAEELGVAQLGNIDATDENIESIFYGTIINMINAIDKEEMNQIKAFPQDGDTEAYQMLLNNALSDAPSTSSWTEEELTDLVVTAGSEFHNAYIEHDTIQGLLDQSFLGFEPIFIF